MNPEEYLNSYAEIDLPSIERTDISQLGRTIIEAAVYRPAPIVVEDTQTGFDLSGNFHVRVV